MTDSSLVSVIIRTKNRPQLLHEALASVLGQSYSPVEILVVNDGGEDIASGLPDISPETGKSISYHNLQPGKGRSAAANTGLENATGEYCIFLDDDDWFDSDHIGNLVNALQDKPGYLAAYSCVQAVSKQEKPGRRFDYPFDPVRLLLENYIPIHAVLFSRTLVEKGCRFDLQFDRMEDWDFWLQAARWTSFYFIRQCTAHYRIDSDSGFGAKDEENTTDTRLAVYRKWLGHWRDEQLLDLLNRAREFPRLGILENEKRELKDSLLTREAQIDNLGNLLMEAQDRASRQALEIRDLHALVNNQQALMNNQQAQINSLHHEMQIVYNSRSWRLTKPLRDLNRARQIRKSKGTWALLNKIRQKLFMPASRLPKLGSGHDIAQSYQPLSFSPSKAPMVSIVIPVYNKHLYTFHCLQAVLQNTGADIDFDVIVVDDRSDDETGQMLEQMKGITVLRNEQNLGFIRSCNRGAQQARGKYLVLLNNDTEPRPGWLQALLETFTDFPEAGMVGSRLVYPDGKLQEAGGIVWQDGSAWNYGRNDDPNKPEYSYCREADYCSGACLMLPAADFKALDMFDELYLPAYYEDTDLAFKVRKSGKKVFYQPLSTVIHFEGISSGTDTGDGIKRYQEINHEKFYRRWQPVLKRHRPNGSFPHLEKERNVSRRVLIVDARVLMPDHDSGSVRMFSLLKIFIKLGYKVSFLPDNLQYHERYTPQMQKLGIECFYHPYTSSVTDHLQHHGHLYDLVMLSRADVAQANIKAVTELCPKARVLFDTVDLHFLREKREGELNNDKALLESALVRKQQELGIARQCDLTLVVSPVEVELFKVEAPEIPLALLSNIHRTEPTEKTFAERRDILFIANFEHPPNIDAMVFFLDEVFPLIQAENSDIGLKIVGGHPPRQLKNRAGDKVEITGFISDIKPLFNDIRLSIAPLRYGAGVKGKINSSMAYGVPVVTTTVGAEGMNLVHEQDVLIADSPEDFARQVLRAYGDESLWQKLSAAGIRNIEEHFSFQLAERQLLEILDRLETQAET